MFKVNGVLKVIMDLFPGLLIKRNSELVLDQIKNLFFRLDNIDNEIELVYKVLEWCSRDVYKGLPFIYYKKKSTVSR